MGLYGALLICKLSSRWLLLVMLLLHLAVMVILCDYVTHNNDKRIAYASVLFCSPFTRPYFFLSQSPESPCHQKDQAVQLLLCASFLIMQRTKSMAKTVLEKSSSIWDSNNSNRVNSCHPSALIVWWTSCPLSKSLRVRPSIEVIQALFKLTTPHINRENSQENDQPLSSIPS